MTSGGPTLAGLPQLVANASSTKMLANTCPLLRRGSVVGTSPGWPLKVSMRPASAITIVSLDGRLLRAPLDGRLLRAPLDGPFPRRGLSSTMRR